MMNLIRKKLSELSSSDIEDIMVLLNANSGTIFHEPNLNQIVAEVFGTEFSYYLAYDGKGTLVAFCPLHSLKDGLLRRTYSNPTMYGIPYGGWVYDESTVSLNDLFHQLRLSNNEALTYWSVPQITRSGYSSIKNCQAFQTGIIDLSFSLDEILYKSISRKRRETIRSASRKGVIVEQLDASNLSIFLEQCDILRTAVGLKPFPHEFFLRLFESYHEKKNLATFASRVSSDFLASGMIIGNEHMMHLWVAGKPKETNISLPRQDLIVWEAIKWSKDIGCKYFDLCVIESERLPSIAKFKFGFSKQIVPFYLYSKRNFGYRIFSRIRRILGLKH